MSKLILYSFLTILFGLLSHAVHKMGDIPCFPGMPEPWCSRSPCDDPDINPKYDQCWTFMCGGCYAMCLHKKLNDFLPCSGGYLPYEITKKVRKLIMGNNYTGNP